MPTFAEFACQPGITFLPAKPSQLSVYCFFPPQQNCSGRRRGENSFVGVHFPWTATLSRNIMAIVCLCTPNLEGLIFPSYFVRTLRKQQLSGRINPPSRAPHQLAARQSTWKKRSNCLQFSATATKYIKNTERPLLGDQRGKGNHWRALWAPWIALILADDDASCSRSRSSERWRFVTCDSVEILSIRRRRRAFESCWDKSARSICARWRANAWEPRAAFQVNVFAVALPVVGEVKKKKKTSQICLMKLWICRGVILHKRSLVGWPLCHVWSYRIWGGQTIWQIIFNIHTHYGWSLWSVWLVNICLRKSELLNVLGKQIMRNQIKI